MSCGQMDIVTGCGEGLTPLILDPDSETDGQSLCGPSAIITVAVSARTLDREI